MTEVMNKETVEPVKKTRKKTTTKKETATNNNNGNEEIIAMLMQQIAELQQQINSSKNTVSVEETPKEKVAVKTTSKKVTFQDIKDKEVGVERVVGGLGVVYWLDKKTGDEYTWNEVNEVQYLTVETLKRMNTSPLFLKTPWLKVLDDEAIEVLNLTTIYRNIEIIEDFEQFNKMSDFEIQEILSKLSREYVQTLATNISSKISSNEITDMRVISRFERLLNKEFII